MLYLKSAGETENIDRVLLSGGAVRIPDLVDILVERVDAPVEVADPLRRVQFDPVLFGSGRPEEVASALTVGLGLAMRKVDDR